MVEKVYLIRHGHVDNGGEKRYLGRTDVPLDALGLEQAQALREYFKTIPIDAVFTSPLKRCVQTTEIISKKYQVVEALREIDMGDWDNMPMSHIKLHFPKLYAQRGEDLEYFTSPNGESFHDVAQRVMKAFDEIVLNYAGTIIIVAHAGVNRVLLAQLLGLSLHEMFSIRHSYACINELIHEHKNAQWHYRSVLIKEF